MSKHAIDQRGMTIQRPSQHQFIRLTNQLRYHEYKRQASFPASGLGAMFIRHIFVLKLCVRKWISDSISA
jgi:hypothetical protein